MYNRLPEDEPLSAKRVEDINITSYNINLENVHFVGLYCIITVSFLCGLFCYLFYCHFEVWIHEINK